MSTSTDVDGIRGGSDRGGERRLHLPGRRDQIGPSLCWLRQFGQEGRQEILRFRSQTAQDSPTRLLPLVR